MKITLKKLLEQILKNQQILLACGQMTSMHDIDSKEEARDAAFKGASDTRFILDALDRQTKKKTNEEILT